ncbi:hypothetical protein AB0H88_36460 [Nonomuraea sp. NPDC050680]|uniref:hypothetical protein n=1 Tax=Nonomuraea sp. NPDC050680 TaxID=3154630 RepID=UPI0033D58D71
MAQAFSKWNRTDEALDAILAAEHGLLIERLVGRVSAAISAHAIGHTLYLEHGQRVPD